MLKQRSVSSLSKHVHFVTDRKGMNQGDLGSSSSQLLCHFVFLVGLKLR